MEKADENRGSEEKDSAKRSKRREWKDEEKRTAYVATCLIREEIRRWKSMRSEDGNRRV